MRYKFREYRKGHFQVYFSHEGKQVFIQKTIDGRSLDSPSSCRALIIHLREYGFDPRKFGQDKTFNFDKAIQTWIKLSNVSPEWLEQRRQIADRFFIPYFKKMDIRNIKSIHISEFHAFLKSKGLKDKSIYNYMGELRTFFRFHRKSLTELPDFPRIGFQEPQVKFLSREDQDKIFQFIPDEDLPIFEFMRQYGCRENEAAGLLKENVFLDHDPPYFVISTVLGAKDGKIKNSTKTKRVRILPILDEVRWVFESSNGSEFIFYKNGPYTNRRLVRIWNKATDKSGVQSVNLYNAMRHSFATQRLNDGYGIDGIQKVLGHTNIKTTQRYLKYHLRTLEGVIRGRAVHSLFIPSRQVQIPEKIGRNWLGGKDSNLG